MNIQVLRNIIISFGNFYKSPKVFKLKNDYDFGTGVIYIPAFRRSLNFYGEVRKVSIIKNLRLEMKSLKRILTFEYYYYYNLSFTIFFTAFLLCIQN